MTFSPENSSNVFMVFGQTGNGKSTLIKLFCGDNAPSSIIGHSTESKTKDTSFFNEKDNNGNLKRMWIDTMGTSDSSDNISNEDILRKVMAKMYRNYPKGFNVKVIWLVNKDCRKTRELKIESKFINSLSEYSTSSIWDSTILIVKEGQFKAKSNAKGALGAAAEFYNKTTLDKDKNKLADIDSIGYTMLSVLDDDNVIIEDIENGDITDKSRLRQGYLHDDEIKKEVSILLDSKSFINIKFSEDICLKCGIKGDSRFVPTKCHKQFERKHGINLNNDDDSDDDEFKIEYIHTGEKKWRHKEGEKKIQKHTQSIGYQSHRSEKTDDEYVGNETTGWNYKMYCPKRHDVQLNVDVTSKSNIKCERCKKDFYRVKCCYSCNPGYYCESCCSKEATTPIKRNIYRKIHVCCGLKYPAPPCKAEWLCCGKDTSHPGCIKIWSWCEQDVKDSKGCEEYWTCCNEPVKGGKPCKYSCCKQDRDSRGCRRVCKQCQKGYGKGPGCCTENVKHRFKKKN